jgi:hypothetical protein
MKKMQKRGQSTFGMSFQMIFSILLIVFFVVVAFIAIRAFLKTKDCAQVGIFIEDFETEIKKAWNSQKSSFEFKGRLPTKLDYVCFANLSRPVKGEYEDIGWDLGVYQGQGGNTFFFPHEKACGMPFKNVKHLDVESITASKNPYCIPIADGVISFQIEKRFNERLVRVR